MVSTLPGTGTWVLGFLGLQAGLAGLDRVDHVMLDGVHVGVGQVAFQRVQLGGADGRALALGDELDAFGGGVGALVELAGQELGGEDLGAGEVGQVVGHIVHLRLAEHGGHGLVEQLLGDAFDVIAVHDAQGLEAGQSEDRAQFARKLLGFDIKAGLLFHVHAKNHGNPFLKLKTIGSPREGSQIMHYSATSMPSDLASSARRSSISS